MMQQILPLGVVSVFFLCLNSPSRNCLLASSAVMLMHLTEYCQYDCDEVCALLLRSVGHLHYIVGASEQTVYCTDMTEKLIFHSVQHFRLIQ